MIDSTQIVNRGTVEGVVNRDLDGREFTNAQTAQITGLPRSTVQRAKATSVTSVYDVLQIAVAAELRKQGVDLPLASTVARTVTPDQWADLMVAEESGTTYFLVAESTAGDMKAEVIRQDALGAHVGRAALILNLTRVAREVFTRVLLELRLAAGKQP